MKLSINNILFLIGGISIAPVLYFGFIRLIPIMVLAKNPPFSVLIRPTVTPLPTSTPSPTLTPTETPTPFPTATPIPTLIPSPTSTPTPTPVPVTADQLDGWFTQYSNHFSIDRAKLWKIAVCESGLRSSAVNGIYGGMYQFSASAWGSTRISMNENPDPELRFSPEEAIKTAAFKMSVSGYGAWPNCGQK